MSVRCPSCGFEAPDGAAWCDFCKQPFGKAPKAAPPDPLQGLTKEQLLDLPADRLLKSSEPALPTAPPWLRPLAWTMLAVWLALAGLALRALYSRYKDEAPAPSSRR